MCTLISVVKCILSVFGAVNAQSAIGKKISNQLVHHLIS